MIEEFCKKYHSSNKSDSSEFVVWAVDDAWFTGDNPINTELDLALEISTTLEELREEVKKKNSFNPNFQYLSYLIEFSLQYGLHLGLCGFEQFEQNFGHIDNSQSAILLDVQNQLQDESTTSSYYGIDLLLRLIKGSEINSQIVFVTAHPNAIFERFEEMENLNDPSWLKLRPYVSSIKKTAPNFRNLLDAFFKDIAEHLKRENRFLELARSLIAERKLGDENTHPRSLEKLKEKKDSIPLIGSFIKAESKEKYTAVPSYKALYHFSSNENLSIPQGVELIQSQVFAEHCEYLGIKIKIEEDRRFRLPIQPGLVFLLYFCKFISELNDPKYPPPVLYLLFNETPDAIWASLYVEMNDNNDFRSSVLGAQTHIGQAAKWFKNTLTCLSGGIFELASIPSTTIPWGEQRLVEGSKTFQMIVEPEFSINGITIKWKC